MRVRYMAFFGFAWMVPSIFGHADAGIIMDNYDPRWVWYLGGILSAIAVAGFLFLHTKAQELSPSGAVERAEPIGENSQMDRPRRIR